MPRKKVDEFKVGDIVEVVESPNQHVIGCVGEVVDLGPPIQIAVVHILPFEANHLRRKVDLAALSWNGLRAYAKSLDIPAKGTRPELEAKIGAQMKLQCGFEVVSPESETVHAAGVRPKFKKNQIVKIKMTAARFPGHRGKVADPGPPVMVYVSVHGKLRKTATRYDDEGQLTPI